jgi:hypothetical protein
MSGTTRQKTFVELVSQRTPANARNDLDVYSRSETLAAIPEVDLSAYTLLSTTASVSGALSNEINLLETNVQDISGALTTDISNLDLSFTQKISEECMLSEGVSGSGTTISGHIIVTINGTQFKIATVA